MRLANFFTFLIFIHHVHPYKFSDDDVLHFAHVTNAINITYSAKYVNIGSSLTINCSFDGKLVVFGYSKDRKEVLSFREIPLFTVTNQTNSITARIQRVPEAYFGIRHNVVCVSVNNTNAKHIEIENFYFGKKPAPVEEVICDGKDGKLLECDIKRPSRKSHHTNNKSNMTASVVFFNRRKSETVCAEQGGSRASMAHCDFKFTGNYLTVRHTDSEFFKSIEIKLKYCDAFGCTDYWTRFNRSSVETPAKVCLSNTTSTLGGFRFVISDSKLTYGRVDKYCLTCKAKSQVKNLCIQEKTGRMDGLLKGEKYLCGLKRLYPFSSRWSDVCEHFITTVGKEPDTGPIFYPGMFSLMENSNIVFHYTPPSLKRQNGHILQYGLATSNRPPPQTTSDACRIETKKGRTFYLFARNSYGWCKNATKVIIPSSDKILPTPSLELWRKSRDTYQPHIVLSSEINPEDISRTIYVICDLKEVNCRTLRGPVDLIKISLAHEKLAVVIQTIDGRTSHIKMWIQHYCLEGSPERIKEDSIEANLIENTQIEIKVPSSHLHCSSYSRRPLPALNISYVCDDTSHDYVLRRSEDRMSTLKIDYKGSTCRLFVRLTGQEFGVPIHKSIRSHSRKSPESTPIITTVLILLAVLFILVAISFFIFKKCRRYKLKELNRKPEWLNEKPVVNTSGNYLTQGLYKTTEMTSLSVSTKPPPEEIPSEIVPFRRDESCADDHSIDLHYIS